MPRGDSPFEQQVEAGKPKDSQSLVHMDKTGETQKHNSEKKRSAFECPGF